MIAIDTSVLIRLITLDNAEQAAKAQKLMMSGSVFISLIVLLETEWVLRSSHGYSRTEVATALLALFSLPEVVIEQDCLAEWALNRHAAGADLGDMLLLISARETSGFATFDRRLAKRAGPTPPVPVELIL